MSLHAHFFQDLDVKNPILKFHQNQTRGKKKILDFISFFF